MCVIEIIKHITLRCPSDNFVSISCHKRHTCGLVYEGERVHVYCVYRLNGLSLERSCLARRAAAEQHQFWDNNMDPDLGEPSEYVSIQCEHCKLITENYPLSIYKATELKRLLGDRELEENETFSMTLMFWHLAGHPSGLKPLVLSKEKVPWLRFVGSVFFVTENLGGHYVKVESRKEGSIAISDPVSETTKFTMEDNLRASILEKMPPSSSGTYFSSLSARSNLSGNITWRHEKLALLDSKKDLKSGRRMKGKANVLTPENSCGIMSSMYVWHAFVKHGEEEGEHNSMCQEMFYKRVEQLRKCKDATCFRLMYLYIYCEIALFNSLLTDEGEQKVRELWAAISQRTDMLGFEGMFARRVKS